MATVRPPQSKQTIMGGPDAVGTSTKARLHAGHVAIHPLSQRRDCLGKARCVLETAYILKETETERGGVTCKIL